jgi:BON domain
MKTSTSDKALGDAVRTELEWDPKVDQTHIGVAAADGAVTLTGYVTSYAQEHAAVRAAERIYGVRAVADELEVRLSRPFKRNDTEIAEEISRQRGPGRREGRQAAPGVTRFENELVVRP